MVYNYPKYLDVNILMPKIFKRVKPQDVKNYIFDYFNAPEPTQWDFLSTGAKFLQQKEKWNEQEKKKYEEEMGYFQSTLKEYNEQKRVVEDLRKKDKLKDPLSTVTDVSKKALLDHDLTAWRLINLGIINLVDSWIRQEALGGSRLHRGVRREIWDPYAYFAKLLRQHLAFVAEVVNTSGHRSFVPDILTTCKHLAISFAYLPGRWSAIMEMISLMKSLGKEIVDRGEIEALHPVFDSLGELGEQSIWQREQESFEEICRSIGWLGEHLIMRGIPIEPLTPNYDATGVIESIENCLQKIKGMLIKERFCVLSQIYYEAIEKITQKLIDKGREEQTFENALVTITRCIAECGEEAAKIGDSRVVSDSIYWLKNIYYYTERVKWFKEIQQDIFDWMAETGALCACHNKPIEDPREASILFFKPTSAKQDLIEVVIQEMGSINDEQRMKNAMRNIYGKYPDYHEAVWEFITRMGKVCKSNFGFNFDWDTGERYAPDDPRREKINRF
jgi:hypothetical protein